MSAWILRYAFAEDRGKLYLGTTTAKNTPARGNGVNQNTMEKYYELIQKAIARNLAREKYYVFLFGSRAIGNEGSRSDIDVGLMGESAVSLGTLSCIREELEESIIPYHVEIVDFCSVSEKFKTIALSNIVIWNKPDIDLKLN